MKCELSQSQTDVLLALRSGAWTKFRDLVSQPELAETWADWPWPETATDPGGWIGESLAHLKDIGFAVNSGKRWRRKKAGTKHLRENGHGEEIFLDELNALSGEATVTE